MINITQKANETFEKKRREYIILDELSKPIYESVPWCILFVDDIVLSVKTTEEVNVRIEDWMVTLKVKDCE